MCIYVCVFINVHTVTSGLFDTGSSDTGSSDTGSSNTGLSNTGLSNTGLSDTGLSENLIYSIVCCGSPSPSCVHFYLIYPSPDRHSWITQVPLYAHVYVYVCVLRGMISCVWVDTVCVYFVCIGLEVLPPSL